MYIAHKILQNSKLECYNSQTEPRARAVMPNAQ